MSTSVSSMHRTFANQGLVRSDRKILGGVCGGIATKLGTEVWAVRLAFIVLAVFVDPAPLLYVVLWVLMPNRSAVARAFGADQISPGPAPVQPPTTAPVTLPQTTQFPTDAVTNQPLDLNKESGAAGVSDRP